MNKERKRLWLKYAKKFKLRSLEEIEKIENILDKKYDNKKFYIQDIGKNEYWSVKETR